MLIQLQRSLLAGFGSQRAFPCPDQTEGCHLWVFPYPVAVHLWRFAKWTTLLEAGRKLWISN